MLPEIFKDTLDVKNHFMCVLWKKFLHKFFSFSYVLLFALEKNCKKILTFRFRTFFFRRKKTYSLLKTKKKNAQKKNLTDNLLKVNTFVTNANRSRKGEEKGIGNIFFIFIKKRKEEKSLKFKRSKNRTNLTKDYHQTTGKVF